MPHWGTLRISSPPYFGSRLRLRANDGHRSCDGIVWLDVGSLGQSVLVDDAVLHDDFEAIGGIGNQVDVVQRISVDKQQIRECALFHDAELAGIGIALAGQRQQFGVCRCRHDQRFGGGIPASERGQNCPLLLRQRAREQDVGTPRRLDLVLLCKLVGPGYAGPDLIRLGSLRLNPPESPASSPRGGAASSTKCPSRQAAWRLPRPSACRVRYTSRQPQWLSGSQPE